MDPMPPARSLSLATLALALATTPAVSSAQRAFRDAQWIDGEGEYLTTNQGLFLKASYLFRF